MASPSYAVRGDLLRMARTMSDEQIAQNIHAHLLTARPDRAALAALRYVQTERANHAGYRSLLSVWSHQ